MTKEPETMGTYTLSDGKMRVFPQLFAWRLRKYPEMLRKLYINKQN